jgi:hypothetical protein
MEPHLLDYYRDLDVLCARLASAGLVEPAAQLSDAKAGGSTSGEILSTTGAILRQLQKTVKDPSLNDEIDRLLSIVQDLWRS